MLQSATAVTVTAVAIILLLVKHQKLIMARQNKLIVMEQNILMKKSPVDFSIAKRRMLKTPRAYNCL